MVVGVSQRTHDSWFGRLCRAPVGHFQAMAAMVLVLNVFSLDIYECELATSNIIYKLYFVIIINYGYLRKIWKGMIKLSFFLEMLMMPLKSIISTIVIVLNEAILATLPDPVQKNNTCTYS